MCREPAATRGGAPPGGERASTGPRHIPALDGLRGVAILMVFLYHAAEWAKPQEGGEPLALNLLRSGWVGVDLFFVLSGFLITGILYEARGTEHAFRNFYMRRVLRIFPLYYGVLAVLFLVGPRLGWFDTPGLEALYRRQGYLWTYTTNFYTAWTGRMAFKVDWLNVGHFWSLAIEEHFYLFWPFLVLHLERKRLVGVCAGIILVAPLLRLILTLGGASWVTPYSFTLCRMDALALGALIAILSRGSAGMGPLVRWSRWVAVGSGVLLAAVFVVRRGIHPFDRWIHSFGFSLLALFFGSVLVLVVTSSPRGVLGRVFGSRLLRAYGKYSYAIYVYHKVLESFVTRWGLHARLGTLLGSRLAGGAAATVVLAFFFLGLGWVSWQVYEKQFLKLKRHFAYVVPERGPLRQRTRG